MSKLLSLIPILALAACSVESGGYPNGVVVFGESAPPAVPAAKDGTGRWEWTHASGYVWTTTTPEKPRPDAEWNAPHWAVRGRHYVWVRGFYR